MELFLHLIYLILMFFRVSNYSFLDTVIDSEIEWAQLVELLTDCALHLTKDGDKVYMFVGILKPFMYSWEIDVKDSL